MELWILKKENQMKLRDIIEFGHFKKVLSARTEEAEALIGILAQVQFTKVKNATLTADEWIQFSNFAGEIVELQDELKAKLDHLDNIAALYKQMIIDSSNHDSK